MSDIGITFPVWFLFGLALLYALPFTTLMMAGIGGAWLVIRRRAPQRRLPIAKWAAIIVAPFWLAGIAVGACALIAFAADRIADARRHATLQQPTEIAGIAFPVGATIERDESEALSAAQVPEGVTVTLNGAAWRDRIEFTAPNQAPNAAQRTITAGTLAVDAVIQGVPCRVGQRVEFLWGGPLMDCVLSRDTAIGASINGADGTAKTQTFRCQADNTVNLQPTAPGQLAECLLAAPAQIGEVVCAADAGLRISNGNLDSCTLAKPARFGPLDLPAGSKVIYYEARPSSFALATDAGDVPMLGLALPGGTEGAFCYKTDKLEQLTVDAARYVTIAGVKLTSLIEFDCGALRDGRLFEDTVLGGQRRSAGEQVTRADLYP